MTTALGEFVDVQVERLLKAGRRTQARRLLKAQVARHPTNLMWRLRLADLFGPRADAVAVEQLRELIALEPQPAEVWSMLGDRLSWTGRPAEAVDAFERAAELAPADVEVKRKLAQHLTWTDQTEAALEQYRGLVRLGGRPADRATLVDLLLSAQEATEAIVHGQVLVRQVPEVSRHRHRLADAALRADRCDVALEALRWITAREPTDLKAWGRRAVCAKKVGRRDEALEAFATTQALRRKLRSQTGG